MKISTFFTWFWILYLPFCILFYDRAGFQYIDELMTLGLILFTFIKKTTGHHIKKEIYTYGILMVFYVLYSLVMAINVPASVFLDLQQQVRPYCIFFCTYLLAPTFTKKQQKIILYIYIIAIAYFLLGFRFGKTPLYWCANCYYGTTFWKVKVFWRVCDVYRSYILS